MPAFAWRSHLVRRDAKHFGNPLDYLFHMNREGANPIFVLHPFVCLFELLFDKNAIAQNAFVSFDIVPCPAKCLQFRPPAGAAHKPSADKIFPFPLFNPFFDKPSIFFYGIGFVLGAIGVFFLAKYDIDSKKAYQAETEEGEKCKKEDLKEKEQAEATEFEENHIEV